jgi:acetyl esterase/lipase
VTALLLLLLQEPEVVRDVVYGHGGSRALRMHLVKPKSPPPGLMPVVVYIHGGAWRSGSKEGGLPLLKDLARKGYFGASIEYRFSAEAKFPAQIEDCKCAIRFLREKATEYKLDPDRVGVWGSSAGGYLAALLGTSGGVKELEGSGGWPERSSRVQAVVDWFGPTDFLTMGKNEIDHDAADSPESQLIGGPIQENKEKTAKSSPLTYVSADDPPFLLMHGDQDNLVPPAQSERLQEALTKAGVKSVLKLLPGQRHGFKDVDARTPVLEFFELRLKK